MSLQTSDAHGQLVLRELARQQRAKAILRKIVTPGQAILSTLGLGLVAAAVAVFAEKSAMSEPMAAALVAWGAVVTVVVAAQLWRIERRLNAVVELLKIDHDD